MSSTLPVWVSVLSAMLTPTIAVIAVYIAWQQWRTNRNKLKLDLFERRYAFYEAARGLIGNILTSGKATDKTTFEFLMKTKGVQFVVGAEIAAYFEKELYSKAIDLQTLDAELQGVGVGPARSENVRRQGDIKKWFGRQNVVLDEKFRPFLRLKH